MKIIIGSDHAGYELKADIINFLKEKEYEVMDMGPYEYSPQDDYPDYIKKVGEYISEHNDSEKYRGIVIGGSGQGENICANKYKNVRSILIYGNDIDLNNNIAILSRQHNDANIISFAARFINTENALIILNTWLKENFSKDERHIRRLLKIENK